MIPGFGLGESSLYQGEVISLSENPIVVSYKLRKTLNYIIDYIHISRPGTDLFYFIVTIEIEIDYLLFVL